MVPFPMNKDRVRLISSVLISALVLAMLYVWIDYSTGYGQKPATIYTAVSAQWGLEDWSHCVMVPFAALLIIYLDRAKLLALPLRGVNAGLPVLALGFFFYWFGFKADNIYFSYAAFQFLLAGMILWFGGWGWMKGLSFPWMFLFFMWPLLFLESFVSFPLRMMVSHSGVVILNLIGIPSVLNGTGILSAADAPLHFPPGQRFAVDVALPCSGMRSLFALMMVSALFGYFTLTDARKRVLLFLAAIPLAIAGNICRIVMLTIGTLMMGSERAIGTLEHPSFFHMLAGYGVFIVALGGMFGVSHLLSIRGVAASKASSDVSRNIPAATPRRNGEGDLY